MVSNWTRVYGRYVRNTPSLWIYLGFVFWLNVIGRKHRLRDVWHCEFALTISYPILFCGHPTAILSIKAYVEVYEGKIRHQQVNYKNFRNTTHAIMVLIGLSTVAFNCALWPHYGWNAPIILGIFFFGIILQFLLIFPTSVQNVVALVCFTFFLQEYSGYSNFI